MIPVKICGITSLVDANFVADNGASAIGFIFYSKSPRYIEPELAYKIISKINNKIAFVGVFVNEKLDLVNAISRKVGLDFVQLHGDESPSYCSKIERPVIKVFRVSDFFDIKVLNAYNAHAYLFDTYKKACYGGTGQEFNWSLISKLNLNSPVILSGGLSEVNINDGIRVVMPNAVDVNSSIEKEPGIKSHKKIKSLFKGICAMDSLIDPFKNMDKKGFQDGV